ALHEVEHLGVGVERGPRRERDPGGPERDASGPHGSEGGGDVGPRVALVEMGEHGIAQRLDGGDDEETAEGAKLRQVLALAEQVPDLRRDVEGDSRELTVKRARDVERVAGAVQEVGIAERDVSGAGVDELADIGHDDVAIDDEEAPAVHGRDRAVTAVMLAAATGLDVAGQLEAAVSTLEVRVLLEAPKERARWGREVELREDRSRRSARPDRSAIRGGLEMAGQLDERVFHFAAHDGVRAVSQEMLGIQRRVQAVEADVGRRIFLAHARG